MPNSKAAGRPESPELSFPAAVSSELRRDLLRWFDQHQRDLPWRRRRQDAYAQLLAEFMLQQTQVATVIPYYERFITRFPSASALAAGSLDDVLAMWSGLGYYSRARNLHRAAQQIVERFKGTVPRTVEDLRSLPGIGRYTAGAIASVAYDVRAPILDGNVTRVLMRLLALDEDPQAPATRDRLWRVAEEILPRKRCGDFNQALMELGATVCSPVSPQCLLCPLREICAAHRQGLSERIPPPRRRTAVKPLSVVVIAVAHKDRMLFKQRPIEGLWGGLWELPSETMADGETQDEAIRRLQRLLPIPCVVNRKELSPVRRTLTHRVMTFHIYRAKGKPARTPDPTYRWLGHADLKDFGLSRAAQAILAQLDFSTGAIGNAEASEERESAATRRRALEQEM